MPAPSRSADLLPTLAVAGAAAVWGCWWIPVRRLETLGLAGDWVTVGIAGLSSLLLLPLALARLPRFRAGAGRLLLVSLLFGGAISTWNHALLTGEVVRVTLLFYLAPIWASILGFLLLREPLTPLRLLCILLGLGGAVVVLGLEGGIPVPRSEGEWLGLASGMIFALAATAARRFGTSEGFERVYGTFVAAVFIALGLALASGLTAPPAPDRMLAALPLLAAVAAILFIPPMWLVLWGASRLDPGRVSVLLLFEVAAATISAGLLTDEPFGWREGIGCALIATAGLLEGFQAAAPRPRAATG